MKVQTNTLSGKQLHYAVAKALGLGKVPLCFLSEFCPSEDPEQGLKIVEENSIGLTPPRLRVAPNGQIIGTKEDGWFATSYTEYEDGSTMPSVSRFGPTALVAAMRCFVATKFAEGIEIPEELL